MRRIISLLFFIPTIAVAQPYSARDLGALGMPSPLAEKIVRGTQSSSSYIIGVDGDAQRLFTFDASSDTALTLTFGDSSTTANQIFSIVAGGGANDDDTKLILAGGSSGANTEGAYISLAGNEFSGGGDMLISAGDTSGIIEIQGGAANDLTIQDNLITVVAGTTLDVGAATAVLEVPNGTDLPATCSIGSLFVDTDDNACLDAGGGSGATCSCQATNTWVEIS